MKKEEEEGVRVRLRGPRPLRCKINFATTVNSETKN